MVAHDGTVEFAIENNIELCLNYKKWFKRSILDAIETIKLIMYITI